MLCKFPRVAVPPQKLGNSRLKVSLGDETPSLAIELQDAGEHPVKAGPQEIATLGEEGVERMTVILQAAALVATR